MLGGRNRLIFFTVFFAQTFRGSESDRLWLTQFTLEYFSVIHRAKYWFNMYTETVTEKRLSNLESFGHCCYEQHTHTHTQPFNGPLSRTTRVSRYQKGKTNLDFTEAREWVAVASAEPYASLHLAPDRQPRQHPTTQFFTGRMPFLPPNQQRQSTEQI